MSQLVKLLPPQDLCRSWVETHIKLSSLEMHARFATCLELFESPQLASIQDELLPFYELKISDDILSLPITCKEIKRWTSLCQIYEPKTKDCTENIIVDGEEERLEQQIDSIKQSVMSLLPEKRAFYIDKLFTMIENISK